MQRLGVRVNSILDLGVRRLESRGHVQGLVVIEGRVSGYCVKFTDIGLEVR